MAKAAFDAKREKGQDKDYDKGDFTTPESLVKHLLSLVPYSPDDLVVDAGSGTKKVFYDNIDARKEEYEIKEGKDFYECKEADWCVGNPPFREFIGFLFHSSKICKKGFAFLTNHSRINQLTPRRFETIKEAGFYPSKLHIFGTKKWFGRYYFIIFTRKPGDVITWSLTNFD